MNFKEYLMNTTTHSSQKVVAALHAPTQAQIQCLLFLLGVGLVSIGLADNAQANGGHYITFDHPRKPEAMNAILTYIEGAFGAMVMAAAGIGAIISAAFRQYKTALGLLVIAVASFVLRSLVYTFFNADNIQQ